MTDSSMSMHRSAIIVSAARNAVPATYEATFASEGGLMSYGPNHTDLFRRAAAYVDRVLHGAKPSELPVEVPAKFELIINLKAAKTLGLTLSPGLLAIADQVID